MVTATEAWLRQVKKCVDDGQECGNTLELLSSSLSFDMSDPIVLCKGRKVNYGFMFAEAAYIIQGWGNVRYLENHISKFKDYSDLYPLQQGSYGPPFVEQLRYVVETLQTNDESRQAVMTIWRPNPRLSKDIPCTLSLQFIIRDSKLHTIVTMRSSDIFTGLIYDMFCFTAMSAVVLAFLDFSDVKLGKCWINAGSSHLYKRDFDRIKKVDEEMHDYSLREWPHSYEDIIDMLMNQAEVSR
jgi:thymidylate synthase